MKPHTVRASVLHALYAGALALNAGNVHPMSVQFHAAGVNYEGLQGDRVPRPWGTYEILDTLYQLRADLWAYAGPHARFAEFAVSTALDALADCATPEEAVARIDSRYAELQAG